LEGYPPFKDGKLYPDGAREWDWGETDTHHEPGIQPADVEELLEYGAKVVILCRGMLKRLKVCYTTIRRLKDRGVATHILPTKKAVKVYNQLREKESVGGLFHSTC